ncbi:thiamine pyrophosphate-dependent enzyme [Nocardioides sp. URHA0032]|uniref:thiamine pyrophosphate-dependent enzyme n=1 Tax=Nocardioides sp. URHA0032 TaxID=1380388 RepID=UPI00048B32B7|nr:thiamine pyrophosphate-dependent enzyme [Nocardioides sp. URHA0032]
MERVGLPAYGTDLANPDLAKVAEAVGMTGIRVTDPHAVERAVLEAFAHDGPVLLDVLTNPDEIAVPPKPTPEQGRGITIAKTKEFVESRE